jgi:hypothetical protein
MRFFRPCAEAQQELVVKFFPEMDNPDLILVSKYDLRTFKCLIAGYARFMPGVTG